MNAFNRYGGRPAPRRRSYGRNPYFSGRQRRGSGGEKRGLGRVLSLKAKLYGAAVMGILGVLAWLLFFSSAFVITQIDVRGLEHVSSESIARLARYQTEEKRWFFVSQDRLAAFDSQTFREELDRHYPNFAAVTVLKKIPGTIIIAIAERQPVAVWHEAGSYYKVDAEGWMVSGIEEPAADLPVIENIGEPRLEDHRLRNMAGAVNSIRVIAEEFPLLALDVFIRQYAVDNESDTVKVVLNTDTVLLFKAEPETIKDQLERFAALARDLLAARISSVDYVDLRHGDRVYYK